MSLLCKNCGSNNNEQAKFCNNCGLPLKSLSPFAPLALGKLIENRYQITEIIKITSNRAVYKVKDIKFDSIYILKEFLPPYTGKQEYAVKLFKREAKKLSQISHSQLPEIIDYFIRNDRYYIVMAFIEGDSLEEILKRMGKPGLPQSKTLEWIMQILEIFNYLHSQKPPLIHGNINPGNIIINNKGQAILINFGILQKIYRECKIENKDLLNIRYAPLEQWEGKVTQRTDIYSLGATLHHLLTGKKPFPMKFNSIKRMVPAVSNEMAKVVTKALKTNKSERFINIKDMQEALTFKVIKSLKKIRMPAVPLGEWKVLKNEVPEKLFGVHFVNYNKGWIVGRKGTILHTGDGGFSWENQESTTSEGLIGVHFTDSDNGWIVGSSGTILHTENSGKNWMQKSGGINIKEALIQVHFVDQNNGWATGWKGTILHTDDCGENWVTQESNVYEDLEGLFFIDEKTGWIAGWNGTILYTEDGGKKWSHQKSNTYECLSSIHFVDHNHGWAVGWKGTIVHTEDGGENWSVQKTKTSECLSGVQFIDLNKGWVIGWNGIVLYTMNGGNTWKIPKNITSSYLYGLHFIDHLNGWAVGDKGTILKYYALKSDFDMLTFKEVNIKPMENTFLDWFKKAEDLCIKSKYKEAVKYFDKILEFDKNHVKAWVEKGLVLDKMEKYEEALICFDRAINISPEYKDLWYYRGNILLEEKRYDNALNAFDKAIKINPGHGSALNKKGMVLNNLKNYSEAIECFDKAIKLEPEFTDPWFNKGLTFYYEDKYETSIDCFERVLKIDPKYTLAWYNKGLVLNKQRKFVDATNCFNKALKLYHNKLSHLYILLYYSMPVPYCSMLLYIQDQFLEPYCSRL